jgi:tRNA nucleotidyltransferase (CCA-adding enzyme)
MNKYVLKICEAVRDAGGRAMLVGGCVRDRLLGIDAKDFDLEVYNLEPSRLREILQSITQVNTVGEHFAVYKLAFYSSEGKQTSDVNMSRQPHKDESLPNSEFQALEPSVRLEIDVSIPRRESKSGKGHRGFVIQGDPHMTFAEAARRRDFTINAILQDPLTDEIVDPFGGVTDLNQHILRAVAADTFIEDSLRVLRAVQIAARFELSVEPQTIELCRSIELTDLPQERIWGEIEKLLWLANRPSIGLQVALEMDVFNQLFPQIQLLVDSEIVDKQAVNKLAYEPEEKQTAFEQTKRRLDEAAKFTRHLPKERRLAVMLAALCRDLIAASPDENESVIAVLNTLGLYTIAGYDVREQVLSLVREQSRPRQFYESRECTTQGDFRRLAQRVDMNLLYLLAKADTAVGKFSSAEAAEWFREQTVALNLENGAPAPILMGRHLLETGMTPGKQLGETLRRVYELQLDGVVTSLEEAMAAAKLPD